MQGSEVAVTMSGCALKTSVALISPKCTTVLKYFVNHVSVTYLPYTETLTYAVRELKMLYPWQKYWPASESATFWIIKELPWFSIRAGSAFLPITYHLTLIGGRPWNSHVSFLRPPRNASILYLCEGLSFITSLSEMKWSIGESSYFAFLIWNMFSTQLQCHLLQRVPWKHN